MDQDSDEWAVYRRRVPPTHAEWEAFVRATPEGSVVSGTVVSQHPFGVFLDLGWGTSCLGLIELPMLACTANGPDFFTPPPVGSLVEQAMVLGHRAQNYQARLSSLPSDLPPGAPSTQLRTGRAAAARGG